MRPVGDIISDLETIIFELTDDHDLQRGDILALVYNYITVHCPEAIEQYEDDNTNPIYFYGPKESFK